MLGELNVLTDWLIIIDYVNQCLKEQSKMQYFFMSHQTSAEIFES